MFVIEEAEFIEASPAPGTDYSGIGTLTEELFRRWLRESVWKSRPPELHPFFTTWSYAKQVEYTLQHGWCFRKWWRDPRCWLFWWTTITHYWAKGEHHPMTTFEWEIRERERRMFW